LIGEKVKYLETAFRESFLIKEDGAASCALQSMSLLGYRDTGVKKNLNFYLRRHNRYPGINKKKKGGETISTSNPYLAIKA